MFSDKTMMYLSFLSMMAIIAIVAIVTFSGQKEVVVSAEESGENIGGEAFYQRPFEQGYFHELWVVANETVNCTPVKDNFNPYRSGGVAVMFEVYGRMVGPFIEVDECISHQGLYEYWCDGNTMMTTYGVCSGGCFAGRCARFVHE